MTVYQSAWMAANNPTPGAVTDSSITHSGGGSSSSGSGGGGGGGYVAPPAPAAPATETTFTKVYNTQTNSWQNVSAGVLANAPAGTYTSNAPAAPAVAPAPAPAAAPPSSNIQGSGGGVVTAGTPSTPSLNKSWIPRDDLPNGGFWRIFGDTKTELYNKAGEKVNTLDVGYGKDDTWNETTDPLTGRNIVKAGEMIPIWTAGAKVPTMTSPTIVTGQIGDLQQQGLSSNQITRQLGLTQSYVSGADAQGYGGKVILGSYDKAIQGANPLAVGIGMQERAYYAKEKATTEAQSPYRIQQYALWEKYVENPNAATREKIDALNDKSGRKYDFAPLRAFETTDTETIITKTLGTTMGGSGPFDQSVFRAPGTAVSIDSKEYQDALYNDKGEAYQRYTASLGEGPGVAYVNANWDKGLSQQFTTERGKVGSGASSVVQSLGTFSTGEAKPFQLTTQPSGTYPSVFNTPSSFTVSEAKPFQMTPQPAGTYGTDLTKFIIKPGTSMLEAVQITNLAAQDANARFTPKSFVVLPGTEKGEAVRIATAAAEDANQRLQLPAGLKISVPGFGDVELVKTKSLVPGEQGKDIYVRKTPTYKTLETELNTLKSDAAKRDAAVSKVEKSYQENEDKIKEGKLYEVTPAQLEAYRSSVVKDLTAKADEIESGNVYSVTPGQLAKYKAAVLAGDYTDETKARVAKLEIPKDSTTIYLEDANSKSMFENLGAKKASSKEIKDEIDRYSKMEISDKKVNMVLDDPSIIPGARKITENKITFEITNADGSRSTKEMTYSEYIANVDKQKMDERRVMTNYQNLMEQDVTRMAKPDSAKVFRNIPVVGGLMQLPDDALDTLVHIPEGLVGSGSRTWNRTAPAIEYSESLATQARDQGDLLGASKYRVGSLFMASTVPFQIVGETGSQGHVSGGLPAYRAKMTALENSYNEGDNWISKVDPTGMGRMSGELGMRGMDYYASASLAGAGRDITAGYLVKGAPTLTKAWAEGASVPLLGKGGLLAVGGQTAVTTAQALPTAITTAIKTVPSSITWEGAKAAGTQGVNLVKGAFNMGQIGSHGDIAYKIVDSPYIQKSTLPFVKSVLGSTQARTAFDVLRKGESALTVGGLGYSTFVDTLGLKAGEDPLSQMVYGSGKGTARALGETARFVGGETFGKPVEVYPGEERLGILQGMVANYPYYFARQAQARPVGYGIPSGPTRSPTGGWQESAVIGMNVVGRTFITEQAAEDTGLLKVTPAATGDWLPRLDFNITPFTAGQTLGLATGRMVGQELLLETFTSDRPFEASGTWERGKDAFQNRFVYDPKTGKVSGIQTDVSAKGGSTKTVTDANQFQRLWSAEPGYFDVTPPTGVKGVRVSLPSGPDVRPPPTSIKADVRSSAKAEPKATIKTDVMIKTDVKIRPDLKVDLKPDLKTDVKSKQDERFKQAETRLKVDIRPDIKTDERLRADERLRSDERIRTDDRLKQDDKVKPDVKPDERLRQDERIREDERIKQDDKIKLDERIKLDAPGLPFISPPRMPLNLFPKDIALSFGYGGSGTKKGKRSVYADLLSVATSQYRYGRATHGTAERYAPYLGLEQAGVPTVEMIDEKAGRLQPRSRPPSVSAGPSVWSKLSFRRRK